MLALRTLHAGASSPPRWWSERRESLGDCRSRAPTLSTSCGAALRYDTGHDPEARQMAKRRGSAQLKEQLELEAGPTPKTTGKRLPEPDVAAMAKRAVARVAKPDPSGPDRVVSLTVALVMSRAQLEALTARAIREGKHLRGLINELLAAAAERGIS